MSPHNKIHSPRHRTAGFTLPIVMVFMVLSQIIYWGVTGYSQQHLAKNQLYQAAYHAAIQYELARLDPLLQTARPAQLLEQAILTEIQESYQPYLARQLPDHDFQTQPQHGIGILESTEDGSATVYAYFIECRLSDQARPYLRHFEQLTVQSLFDQGARRTGHDTGLADLERRLQDYAQSQQLQLDQPPPVSRRIRFDLRPHLDLSLAFAGGQVDTQAQDQALTIRSSLDETGFQRSYQVPGYYRGHYELFLHEFFLDAYDDLIDPF